MEKKDNGLFFNSAAYLSEGEINHIHRKVFPPTYGMFEEIKFFAQGKNFHTFSAPIGKTGMMICYDFLQLGAGYLLFAGGADIIIVLSAAPGRGHSEECRSSDNDGNENRRRGCGLGDTAARGRGQLSPQPRPRHGRPAAARPRIGG